MNITFRLSELDPIEDTELIEGEATSSIYNSTSALHMIIQGNTCAHNSMIESIVYQLLDAKWKSLVFKVFWRKLLWRCLLLVSLIFVFAFAREPGSDLYNNADNAALISEIAAVSLTLVQLAQFLNEIQRVGVHRYLDIGRANSLKSLYLANTIGCMVMILILVPVRITALASDGIVSSSEVSLLVVSSLMLWCHLFWFFQGDLYKGCCDW